MRRRGMQGCTRRFSILLIAGNMKKSFIHMYPRCYVAGEKQLRDKPDWSLDFPPRVRELN